MLQRYLFFRNGIMGFTILGTFSFVKGKQKYAHAMP